MKVLATAPYFRPVPSRYLGLLQELGIEVTGASVAQRMAEAQLLDIIAQYDGVIAGDDEFTHRVIAKGASGSLRVIVKWGVGVDAIDHEAARAFGVAVRRSPGLLSDAVADQAWGYILMLARRLHESDRIVRDGYWEKLRGIGLRGRTLGIIGLGDIGKQIALRGVPFGMRLLGHDVREVDRAFLGYSGIQMVPKNTLLQNSDVVVVACDLNPSSYHILDAAAIAEMRSGALIINVARGALVDTDAVASALRSGHLGGGAFDVFEVEPLPPDSALRTTPNTLLNAHNAFNTDTSVEQVNDSTVRMLLEVLCPDRRCWL